MDDSVNLQESELFKSLILNFQMSGMIALGKIVNPVSQKAERRLNDAKFAIDMLNMIAAKTKGNLSTEDDQLLQQTLTDLRLNFIQEQAKPEPETEASEVEEEESAIVEDKPAGKKKKRVSKKKKND